MSVKDTSRDPLLITEKQLKLCTKGYISGCGFYNNKYMNNVERPQQVFNV